MQVFHQVIIPFGFYQYSFPAMFSLDQQAVPTRFRRVKPHPITVLKQENLILHESFFSEYGVICVGKDDHLFHLKSRAGFLHAR